MVCATADDAAASAKATARTAAEIRDLRVIGAPRMGWPLLLIPSLTKAFFHASGLDMSGILSERAFALQTASGGSAAAKAREQPPGKRR